MWLQTPCDCYEWEDGFISGQVAFNVKEQHQRVVYHPAWRAARPACGLAGGLPSSPQPLACGGGWGKLPVGTRARCGEAPVDGLA
jgi:hypothetical protein